MAIVRAHYDHIFRGESSVEKPLAHRLRSHGGRADGVAGVGLDELLQNIVRKGAVGGVQLALLRLRNGVYGDECEDCQRTFLHAGKSPEHDYTQRNGMR